MNYYPRRSPHLLTFLDRFSQWARQAVGLAAPPALQPASPARDFASALLALIQAPRLRHMQWLWWVLGSAAFVRALVFYFHQVFTLGIR